MDAPGCEVSSDGLAGLLSLLSAKVLRVMFTEPKEGFYLLFGCPGHFLCKIT